MNILKPRPSRTDLHGTVVWIGVRPARFEALRALDTAYAVEALGLDGDHYARPGGKRQVTLVQAEHLQAVAERLGIQALCPGQARRNIVIRGLDLLALAGRRFSLGEALLEYTGICDPCERMESNLGHGGFDAMRGHGGITARVLRSGRISLGDSILASGD
jgi:MOSC domain-containing protein YiiM